MIYSLSGKISELKKPALLSLQKALLDLKYDVTVDGVFGEKTLEAFQQFKKDYNLTNPKEIGPTTITILNMALSKEFDQEELELPKEKQPILDKPQITYATNWFNFNTPISRYFTIGEVCQWDRARIITNPIHRQNAFNLGKELDKIRENWGKPIGVTSWYRPYAINIRVGGVRNSTHITGSAADIFPINGDVWAFQKWLDSYWDKALGYGAKRGFVHIDLRSSPKRIRWNY